MNKLIHIAAVGIGATAVMDLAGEIIKRNTGIPPLNLAMVGRWVGRMGHGKFAHEHIGKAEPIPNEDRIGLVTHYAIGIGLVPFVLGIQRDWLERPTILPALAVGLGSLRCSVVLDAASVRVRRNGLKSSGT
ncbi:DUF2938 family protein [Corynebacterium epidermidicanis]|uniref:Putative DUF2938 family protein n=1 Tax=Corynebacterium epidermidicanis TaxID=1050174 RepID=A0A0G3GNW5_9CORY|nr:DUF2938 family protein [Corynebacterium epidermidicanis]AKK02921.1 putative DUF2938 family protein [Corynebacterium epidermidicanis]